MEYTYLETCFLDSKLNGVRRQFSTDSAFPIKIPENFFFSQKLTNWF